MAFDDFATKSGEGLTAFMYAAKSYMTPLAVYELFVEQGANLNARGPKGETVLSLVLDATRKSRQPIRKDIVEYLLSQGADVSSLSLA